MIKRNRWKLLISSILILLPALFGLLFWEALPQRMTTHWGADGAADGWSDRGFAVLGIPLLILVLHWLCVLFTARDPGNKHQNGKVFGLVLWICPVTSLFSCGMIYAAAGGVELRGDLIGLLLIGLMFTVIGNYLPKCRQNRTIGIKVKWTLENEENWNATHRLGGRLWVVGGLLLMACVFLPESVIPWVLVVLLPVLAVIPVLYSYLYHRKQVRAGTAVITPLPKSRGHKIALGISLGVVVVILLLVALLMFTGEINISYGATSFTIEASFWQDLTVDYDAIEQISYRETNEAGMRTYGLGSARLQAGAFRNDTFGDYTRYTYAQCSACVVLTVQGETLVLSGPDAEATKEIYDALMERK